MHLTTDYKPLNRRNKAEGSRIGLDFKESVNKIVEESIKAKGELTKMRADLLAESSVYKEKSSRSGVGDSEVVNLVKELQTELIELNEKIDSAHYQIREKEVENSLLKQNISQIMMLEKNQCSQCICSTF